MNHIMSMVDSGMIDIASWGIRQVELYTKYERKDIGKSIFLVFKWFIILWVPIAIVAVLEAVTKGITTELLLLILITWWKFMQFLYFRNKKDFEAQGNELTAKSKEVTTRKEFRCNALLFCFGMLPSIMFVGSFFLKAVTPLLYLSLFFLGVITYFQIFVEYFLCTTPLPPNEKEKEKQEKEMRSMTLQRIRE